MPITVIDLLSSSPQAADPVPAFTPRQSSASPLQDSLTTADEEDDDADNNVLIDIDEVRKRLKSLLKGVKSFGSFVTSNRLLDDVQTGLTINNVGPITLPLSPEQAEQIIAQCHRAPFRPWKSNCRR